MLERLFICVRLLVYSRVSVDWSHVWIQKGRKESLALRRIGGLLLGRTHDHSTNTFNDNHCLIWPGELMESGLDNAKLFSPFPEQHDWGGIR
jgi:hypothetical protein